MTLTREQWGKAMTTKAIEAGARAIYEHEPIVHHCEEIPWNDVGTGIQDRYKWKARLCIEATIASGELVPARAVAEMRERCRKAARNAILNLSREERKVGDICDHAITAAIRQLDTAPASGDYVVGWRTMDGAPKDGTDILAWWSASKVHSVVHWFNGQWVESDDDSWVSSPTHWKPLDSGPLNAASSQGGSE